jgi:hypothetical protein
MNQINMINPFRKNGTWVFNDPIKNLIEEPFVSGIPEMIDSIVGNETNEIVIYFSKDKFPNYEYVLQHIESEMGGNWYNFEFKDKVMKGWLCPALFKYFDKTPKEIYLKINKV